MEWLLENTQSVLFVGTFVAILGVWLVFWLLFRWLPSLLSGQRRTGEKAVPWRYSLGTLLLVTTAAAVAMGMFSTAPIIGGVIAFAMMFCGLCVGRFLQLRRDLVRRREAEVRLLLEEAHQRKLSEAEHISPHDEN